MASQPSTGTGSGAVAATTSRKRGGPLASKEDMLEFAKSASFAFVCVKLALPVLKFAGRKLLGIGGEPQKAGDGPSRGEVAVRQTSIAMPQESEDRWHIVNAPPPAIPDGYKPVASGTFPCSVQDFYGHLFSSAGSPFFIETHRAVGKQWDFVMGGWRAASPDGNGMSPEDKSLLGAQNVFKYVFGEAAPGGFTRLFTFVNPKKPPSPCDTRTVQRQQFCVYEGGVLVFAHAMNMLDIPFKESFTVNIVWVVRPAADGSAQCDATVYLKVNFVKRTLVAGIINATTFKENAAFYKEFFAAVAAHVASNPPLPTAASLRTAANRRASLSQPGGPGRAASLIAGQGADGGNAAAAVPIWKQLRAVLVMLVLVGSLVHQLLLAVQLRRVIAAAGLGSAGGQHAPLLLPWP